MGGGANGSGGGVADLLEVLACTGKLAPGLSGVLLAPLQDAVAGCVSALSAELVAGCGAAAAAAECGNGAAAAEILRREEALCTALGKMLQSPASRELCHKRHVGCGDALARAIVQHPEHHEIQVNAQWALAQVAGILPTLEVVKPIFYSTVAVNAFLWTAAEAKEDLGWEAQRMLAQSAVQKLTDTTNPPLVETQRRCFELLGSRLSADALGVWHNSDLRARQSFAADVVPLLANCGLRLTASPPDGLEGRITAAKAIEALWNVCRGSGSDPVCNPDAQQRLLDLEREQHTLSKVLRVLFVADAFAGVMVEHVIELLTLIHGLPYLVELLKGHWPPGVASVDPNSNIPAVTDSLQWNSLVGMLRMQDYRPNEAAEAVPVICHSVCASQATHFHTLLELTVKVLHRLMDCIQSTSELQEHYTQALRCGAKSVLQYIVAFQHVREGRWPSKSARALKTAAVADPATREALSQSQELQRAVFQRITSACSRLDSDNFSYWELESTFLLALVVWGVEYVLKILEEALVTSFDQLPKKSREHLIQVICRVLSDDGDELQAQDARVILKAMLRTKDILQQKQEMDPQTFGPIAGVLGSALLPLGREATNEEIDLVVKTLVSFIDCITSVENRWVAREVCWGVKTAASVKGGIPAQALNNAGAAEKLEIIAERLLAYTIADDNKDEEAAALGEALEALGLIKGGSFLPMVHSMRRHIGVQAVQLAGLRAAVALVEVQLLPRSPEELEALNAVCQEAVRRFGLDERIRSRAERVLGFANAKIVGA